LRPPSMPAVMWSLAAHHHDTVTARSGDAGNWSKGGHLWRLGHHQSTDRRRTGGELPATSRQQPTHDDSKRQGRRHDHSITAGHNMAMLAFTRQRPRFAFGLGSQDCQRRSPLQQDHDVPIRARHRRRLRAPAIAVLGAVATGVLLVACSAANPPPAAPPGTTRPAPSRAPMTTASARGAELGIFEVSCHTGKGVTASGRPSSRETVSVDPRVVPLGTRLVIDKVGPRVAADTGGAIRGRRLDIWEPSVAACTRFGRRQLRVWQAA
jgi:3D (Asp-Asp-Asp) domain-containing protein